MIEQLRVQLKAKTGLIYLSSFEEERIEDNFIKICKQLNYGLYVWDLNTGFNISSPQSDESLNINKISLQDLIA